MKVTGRFWELRMKGTSLKLFFTHITTSIGWNVEGCCSATSWCVALATLHPAFISLDCGPDYYHGQMKTEHRPAGLGGRISQEPWAASTHLDLSLFPAHSLHHAACSIRLNNFPSIIYRLKYMWEKQAETYLIRKMWKMFGSIEIMFDDIKDLNSKPQKPH